MRGAEGGSRPPIDAKSSCLVGEDSHLPTSAPGAGNARHSRHNLDLDAAGSAPGATFDALQWSVLVDRQDDFRAQLSGIVIPERDVADEPNRALARAINLVAPSFSPWQ